MISPKTKILDLLREYPELEEVLFDISPAFKQLKNPVLRRTVARVTTLQQAAIVGGLKVEDLINRLRNTVETHDHASLNGLAGIPVETHNDASLQPAWFNDGNVTRRLDAREMLNRGEHPVGQVLADLQQLAEGEIYELTAPFNPAPLIDKASGLGFRHWVDRVGEEEYRVYFST